LHSFVSTFNLVGFSSEYFDRRNAGKEGHNDRYGRGDMTPFAGPDETTLPGLLPGGPGEGGGRGGGRAIFWMDCLGVIAINFIAGETAAGTAE